MRCTQTLRVLLAVALALLLFQLPRAAAGRNAGYGYVIPPTDFVGCKSAGATVVWSDCPYPTYRGDQHIYDCTNAGPEADYVKDRDAKIKALEEERDTLLAENKVLDKKLADLQQKIDEAESPGSTTDLPTLRSLQNQHIQAEQLWNSNQDKAWADDVALNYLQREEKKTVKAFHEGCGCTYFCASDYWQCPGGPPPPTPAPNNPKNGIGGGQCR